MTTDEKHNDFDNALPFKSMAAEKKLRLSLILYYAARELKRTWLKLQHPEWDNATVDEELIKLFKHAGT